MRHSSQAKPQAADDGVLQHMSQLFHPARSNASNTSKRDRRPSPTRPRKGVEPPNKVEN